MFKTISVGEAKRKFSELMSQVVYTKDRFIIERKGRPMVGVVSLEDLESLEKRAKKRAKKGLLAAVGGWQDFKNLDKVITEIYNARKIAKDRKIGGLK